MNNPLKERGKKFRRAAAQQQKTKQNIDSIELDEYTIIMYCKYALTDNLNIQKKYMDLLYHYMRQIPMEYFDKKQKMFVLYQFLMTALEIRGRGVDSRIMILAGLSKVMSIDSILQTIGPNDCTTDEIKYIENQINDVATIQRLNSTVRELYDVVTEYNNLGNKERRGMIDNLYDSLSSVNKEIRRMKNSVNTSDNYFALHSMKDTVSDIYRKMTDPSFKLVSGMQGLNAMIGGGFEKRRVYCFFGMSGDGKSTTLENLLVQLWQNNQHIKPTDKTKKPCIVLLTMENFVSETVCSIFNILTGKRLVNCNSAEDVIREFHERGFEYGKAENDISIVIKYQPANSVDTTYLRTLTDELSDEGFETIAFLQDYIGRIIPESKAYDQYQDLGRVMDDFKVFATEYDLPVITAAQLNRDAIRTIEEGRNTGKADLLKRLNRSNIGESIKIDQNLDCSFIILRESDEEDNRYLGFKLVKNRYGNPPITSMYQPFKNNSKGLEQDIYLTKPVYRENLCRTAENMYDVIKRNNIELNKKANMDILNISKLQGSLNQIQKMNNLSLDMETTSLNEPPREDIQHEDIAPPPAPRERKVVMRFVNKNKIMNFVDPTKKKLMMFKN